MGLGQGIIYVKKKDGAYIKHLDEYKLIRTRYIKIRITRNLKIN